MRWLRCACVGVLAFTLSAQQPFQDSITAASLRAHVSFLASDALEGRDTPSMGLAVAAEYIASEFRRAGLESPPGDDYSQSADYVTVAQRPDTFQFSLSVRGASTLTVSADRMSVIALKAVHLAGVSVFKWAPTVRVNGSLEGQVLMLRAPSDPSIIGKLAFSHPDAIVQLTRKAVGDRAADRLFPAAQIPKDSPGLVTVPEGDVDATFDRLPTGETNAHITLNIGEPTVTHVRLRNVIGILRGTDPPLSDQYVIVSAHYDHLGVSPRVKDKDRIYNGANDNASGVASVIELAQAFSRERPPHARTLVFVCFFGEEKGLFGSDWYVKHPLFPLAQTVANFNFEQLGEPQSSEGLPAGSIGVTGYEFTDLPGSLLSDFESAGVRLRNAKHNEDYFERSDNLSFAQAGVVAHTFVAALDFPDYHRTSDQWRKLDYDNMAKIDCGLAMAIADVANRAETPKWNEENKQVKEFLRSWRKLHP